MLRQDLSTAFRANSFPCNPIPFATEIAEGVREHGTDWIKSDDAKKILYVLIAQSYGQLFNLDGYKEWERLSNKTIIMSNAHLSKDALILLDAISSTLQSFEQMVLCATLEGCRFVLLDAVKQVGATVKSVEEAQQEDTNDDDVSKVYRDCRSCGCPME